jgi:murein DD-endopeptidase MepM/ murein hydrolase activator NlpD
MKPPLRSSKTLVLVLAISSVGCEEVEKIQDQRRDRTPHEAYLVALSEAGLARTALVEDWIAASRTAVGGAPLVQLPFHEEGYIAPDEAGAMAYRVQVGRGQRLTARVDVDSPEGTRVFVDLFRVPEDTADVLRPVLTVDTVPGNLTYQPWRGGEYILRVQPELLRGGRYSVVLRLEAQLAFPVDGRNERAIQSGWGAARDGGRRSHEGVDIFAPRGTPVLAAADGVVRRVNVTRLGGKVVWVRDLARNASLYFAHLDSQVVRPGQRVRVGDVLGYVGNTGNARATSPHLHFGIYRRGEGAVDPAPFLLQPPGVLAELTADVAELGAWRRTGRSEIRLRVAPSGRAEVVRALDRYTPVRVLAGSGSWYRVRLPDGATGYVAARLTEALDRPLETRMASAPSPLLREPVAGAAVVSELDAGLALPVLGLYGRYLYVRAPGGAAGWIDGT